MKVYNKIKILALVSLTVFIFSGTASALLIGGPDIIAAPSTVEDDTTTNDHQQGFNERQNVYLDSDLAVDGGFIAAGTWVSSHMIFLNTEGKAFAEDTQTWTFENDILGVMSDSGGTLEAASNSLLGNIGTIYPGAFNARGLEGNKVIGGDNDWYAFNDDSIRVFMKVTEPGDWIRVVTAAPVPEPGTVILLGAGLLGLVGFRKKFRK